MAFVLDASAALAWCFQDEASLFNSNLLVRAEVEELFVPAHWPIEVLSALLRGERRRRIDKQGITEFLALLTSLRIRVEETLGVRELINLRALCERHHLSAYDGTYLALAMKTNLPIATADAALIRACSAEKLHTIT
jgi:predicted nucleic acid-binding protein